METQQEIEKQVEEEYVVFKFYYKMLNMKKSLFLLMMSLFVLLNANANNLVIGTPPIYNHANQTLTFTISWDNSWSISAGPSNWDAVWIFVKRQKCTGNNEWVHQKLNTTSAQHSAMVGGNTSTDVAVDAVQDGMGVFVKRIGANVVGSVATQTIMIKLATTNPTIVTTANDNFKILGIEMVYVPQGEFYVGDGRTTNTNNFSVGTTTQPVKITNAIQTNGLGAYSNYTSDPKLGAPVDLPSTFPYGYNGFYCMKYEISQGLNVEFLNTLTYDQQAVKLTVRGETNLPNNDNIYFNNNWSGFRTYIPAGGKGTFNTVPARFTSVYPHIPENLLWQDLTSILDWSGLRPMSEFEFEKVCRGPLLPVKNEYPWGNTLINQVVNGQYGANITWTSGADGNCNYKDNLGAIRSGFAATSTTNRSQAGATYYGILDIGGQMWEQCVGGGSQFNYTKFTITNGDGVLNDLGLANVDFWPINGGVSSGTILKGGYHYSPAYGLNIIQVSDRTFYDGLSTNKDSRNGSVGGRGVRSF